MAQASKIFLDEIHRRGGDISISGSTSPRAKLLTQLDEREGLVLLHVEGWRNYGDMSRLKALSYLCGHDDNGPWAVRVPGTHTTVRDALRWVEPAAVRSAREQGGHVLRQGDVYAIEARRDSVRLLPRRHTWDPASRMLCHLDPERPHQPLHVPWPARFVAQRVYSMRTGQRAAAD